MSYDLQFAKCDSSDSFEEALEEAEERSPVDAEKQQAKKVLAEALSEFDSGLEIFDSPQARDIELNHDVGIQILLCDNSAHIGVAYWHEGDEARTTFEKLRSYSRIICDTTGYALYDPQIEAVIQPDSIGGDQVATSGSVVADLNKRLPDNQNSSSKPEKPWWKFWT